MDRNWQLSAKGIFDRHSMMLANKELSDCAFLVGSTHGEETRFDAHKFVLASASPVFHAMFYGELKETKTPIVVTDMEGKAFGAMLNYIYTERFPDGPTDDILLLWAAAEKYQLPPLISSCVEILTKALKPENVYDVLEYALLFSNRELEDKCIEHFGSKTTLRLPGFENLPLSFVEYLLDLDSLQGDASEIDLFCALERWAKAECHRQDLPHTTKNMRRVSAGVVRKIRFLTLSADDFTKETYNLLVSLVEDPYPILANIISQIKPNGMKPPLPLEFSISRTPRFAVPIPVIQYIESISVDLDAIATIAKTGDGLQKYADPTKRLTLSFALPVDALLVQFQMTSDDNRFYNFKAYLYRSNVLLTGVKVEVTDGASNAMVMFPRSSELVLEKGFKYSLHIDGYEGELLSITNRRIPFGDKGDMLISKNVEDIAILWMTFLTK